MSVDDGDQASAQANRDQLSLVIITSQVPTMTATATFLERRGVRVAVFSDIQLAIKNIKNELPNAVLISLDYPHPRLDALITLIQAQFSIDCIAFAEVQDRKASAKLTNSKARHVVFGPVSGQIVWLRLRQITSLQQSDASSLRFTGHTQTEKPVDASATIRIRNGGKRSSASLIFPRGRGGPSPSPGQKIDTNRETFKSALQNGHCRFLPSLPSEDLQSPLGQISADKDERRLRRCTRESLAQFCETQKVSQDFLKEYSSTWVMRMKLPQHHVTFVLAIGPLSESQVKSVNVNDVLRRLILTLISSMSKYKIEPSIPDSTLINVQDFVAVSDALLLSSYCAYCKELGTDISLAPFPHGDDAVGAQAEMKTESRGMISIPVSSLRANVTPGFNAYVFMPLNQKYIQFVRKGSALSSQRTSDLIARGITHLLIDKRDAASFTKYHALSHIFKKAKAS